MCWASGSEFEASPEFQDSQDYIEKACHNTAGRIALFATMVLGDFCDLTYPSSFGAGDQIHG